MKRLRGFAITTLAVNVVVIVLGALVRATGSGAGCGSSWPSCKGTLLPELEGATAIEFAHRAASGVALVLVAAMVWLVFRRTRRGQPARLGAIVSGISIVIEALIGAGIVLAELVADDASLARAVSVPIHLVSTYVLLAALMLTVFWLSGGGALRFRDRRQLARPLLLLAFGMLLVAATGGVTALADTLFPKEAFDIGGVFEAAAGSQLDASAGERTLTSLRALHPIVAIAVGLAAAVWAWSKAWTSGGGAGRAARIVVGLVALEAVLGVANVLLLTPLSLSLLHLVIADGIWLAWVWLAAELLQPRSTPRV